MDWFLKKLMQPSLPSDVNADIQFLDLDGNDMCCEDLGIQKLVGQPNLKFLIRPEYHRLLEETMSTFPGRRQYVVTGTAGIGKSAFRFFVIREWLLNHEKDGSPFSKFESVVFNIGEVYLRIEKSGRVVDYVRDLERDWNSICLFDPCKMLDMQDSLIFALKIVTSSPSPLLKEAKKVSINEFAKNSMTTTLVMSAWTEDEILTVSPKVDYSRLLKFSRVIDKVRYCVPRWLAMNEESKVHEEIFRSCSEARKDALLKFVKHNRELYVRDSQMPYSLCRIELIPLVGWAATGFISDYVAKYVYEWVKDKASTDRVTFNDFLQNPFSRGLFGTVFEDWVSHSIGRRCKELQIVDGKGILKIKCKETQFYAWKRFKNGRVEYEKPIKLDDSVFYKPTGGGTCPSIDGYTLHGNNLLLIQPTVALQHSMATYDTVKYLIVAARGLKSNLRVYMVYLVPKKNIKPFSIPGCPTLVAEGAKVTIGYIQDEADLISRFEDYITRAQ